MGGELAFFGVGIGVRRSREALFGVNSCLLEVLGRNVGEKDVIITVPAIFNFRCWNWSVMK